MFNVINSAFWIVHRYRRSQIKPRTSSVTGGPR